MTQDEQFFYEHAGYSYDPKAETQEQGRARCATILADAEAWAERAGVSFAWEADDEPAEYQEEDGTWCEAPASVCVASLEGQTIAALCGIMESQNVQEARDYRRVVEAELASEGRDSLPALIDATRKGAEKLALRLAHAVAA